MSPDIGSSGNPVYFNVRSTQRFTYQVFKRHQFYEHWILSSLLILLLVAIAVLTAVAVDFLSYMEFVIAKSHFVALIGFLAELGFALFAVMSLTGFNIGGWMILNLGNSPNLTLRNFRDFQNSFYGFSAFAGKIGHIKRAMFASFALGLLIFLVARSRLGDGLITKDDVGLFTLPLALVDWLISKASATWATELLGVSLEGWLIVVCVYSAFRLANQARISSFHKVFIGDSISFEDKMPIDFAVLCSVNFEQLAGLGVKVTSRSDEILCNEIPLIKAANHLNRSVLDSFKSGPKPQSKKWFGGTGDNLPLIDEC